MLQKGFEASILAHELRSTLLADARNPGDVVDAVSHQREHVGNLLRRNPELVSNSFGSETLVLHRVDHGDVVAHELQEILVRGDDENTMAGLDGAPSEGSDEIVSLDSGSLQNRKPEGGAEPSGIGSLLLQAVRSRGTVRLVRPEFLVRSRPPASNVAAKSWGSSV
jgi:hypothetical protein